MESFCLLGSAEGLRWQPLSGIKKPGLSDSGYRLLICREIFRVIFFIDNPAVDQRVEAGSKDLQGIAVKDGNVGVLARFQAADAVIHPADPGRVDRDGFQAFFHLSLIHIWGSGGSELWPRRSAAFGRRIDSGRFLLPGCGGRGREW